MKILYLLGNYPQISETYVSNEIDFAIQAGFQVEVWAQNVIVGDMKPQCPVHRGSIAEAVAAARPDLLHIHYLVMAEARLNELPAHIPITIRAHSFDWSHTLASRLSGLPNVKKIYAFPHFARESSHPKVVPLPVAYNSRLHKPSLTKDRSLVLRLAAALPTKGLRDFLQAAPLLPAHRFVLCAARAGGGEDYPNELVRTKGAVDLRFDVPVEDAAALMAKAAIYLDTSDEKGHRFGMPISIAEAMATGTLVLARHSPAAEEFLGGAGLLYESVREAADIIAATATWSEIAWRMAREVAMRRAADFADWAVLPTLMNDWKEILGKV